MSHVPALSGGLMAASPARLPRPAPPAPNPQDRLKPNIQEKYNNIYVPMLPDQLCNGVRLPAQRLRACPDPNPETHIAPTIIHEG